MAFLTGSLVFGNSVHGSVTARAFDIAFLKVMAPHAAFGRIRLMHGRIQRDPLTGFRPCQRMALVAGVEACMMAYPAGIGIGFMGLMVERRKIHPTFGWRSVFADLD